MKILSFADLHKIIENDLDLQLLLTISNVNTSTSASISSVLLKTAHQYNIDPNQVRNVHLAIISSSCDEKNPMGWNGKNVNSLGYYLIRLWEDALVVTQNDKYKTLDILTKLCLIASHVPVIKGRILMMYIFLIHVFGNPSRFHSFEFYCLFGRMTINNYPSILIQEDIEQECQSEKEFTENKIQASLLVNCHIPMTETEMFGRRSKAAYLFQKHFELLPGWSEFNQHDNSIDYFLMDQCMNQDCQPRVTRCLIEANNLLWKFVNK